MIDSVSRYKRWVENIDILEDEVKKELSEMKWKPELIEDAFGTDLVFGTSGLRGIMGAGTNRMNKTVVRKVSQGISNFLRKNSDDPAVVIAYDTRMNSFEYSVAAAEVFCGNGIPVFLFNRTVPVPMLSYAITKLGAAMGIMMTASHNSREYNGYKVYGACGYQILEPVPEMILAECERIDEFSDVKSMNIDEAFTYSLCVHVEEKIIDAYMDDVFACSKKIKEYPEMVYTPLNGAGLEFVTRILERRNIRFSLTECQLSQDGRFETCPYPNPEKKDAYEEAIKTAEETGAGYIMATDPDCDRFGMAVKLGDDFRVLTGNEIGILMFNYICESRRIPRKAMACKSIVTTPVFDEIAKAHKVEVKDTLIGFKYIGEKVYDLEEKKRFIFGMEESHGYLVGPFTWDKDAVGASMLAAEMISWYKDIPAALENIYERYGYVENRMIEHVDKSFAGKQNIKNIMDGFRAWDSGYTVTDFSVDDTGMPMADILKFENENEIAYVRPSGTEPKLKIYLFAKGKSRDTALDTAEKMMKLFSSKVNEFAGGKKNEQ